MTEAVTLMVNSAGTAINAAEHRPGSRQQAAQAVAAVLDALAAHYFEHGGLFGAAHVRVLREMADDARESILGSGVDTP